MTAITNLPWRGAETVAAARNMLGRHHDVELKLPAGYHHAVLSRFQTGSTEMAEQVDVVGGAELLRELASIQGLDQLAELETAVERARMRVRVVSPSPSIVIRVVSEEGA
jgi:hypothetical protein